ncbi:hypothetical protein PR202_gb15230 [Eleusine coracana subsp. coracana]|uniref:malate synthase n=1 Tax=Eleusine coracana subsp. coracana TaxID=191504 RepID=A0AAV5EXF0_ELECO|nr:hypothetical protein PR202_gb15230 [Eleusine coracana subsp. coracana]
MKRCKQLDRRRRSRSRRTRRRTRRRWSWCEKDKQREARAGHDGTWAAHPGLIPAIREVFQAHLGGRPNQIDLLALDNVDVITEDDLVQPPSGRAHGGRECG